MSYSQLGQDLKVLEFYNYKKSGFFIEIGANDGILISNTYLLEKDYNWTGICVEPLIDKFNLLCKNRKNSLCYNYAVYNKSNERVLFDISNKNHLFSGISQDIESYKDMVDSNKIQIMVETITLTDLLEKAKAPHYIDYFSIDTEGSELKILQGINFDKYIFGLIHVEHNYNEIKRQEIKDLLISNNYIYLEENQWDDCYKHISV